MIILVGNEKGGVGKTTIATNLAAMRKGAGHDVVLVDTDKQESATDWASLRKENDVSPSVPSVILRGQSIASEIKDLAPRYEDMVIDAGGRDSHELRAAMVVADKLFIPIRSSQFDVWSLDNLQNIISQAKAFNPNLEAYVFINQGSTNIRVSEDTEAKKLLMNDYPDLLFCSSTIKERVAFRQAAGEGKAVLEMGKSKAADEMMKLYKEVFNAS